MRQRRLSCLGLTDGDTMRLGKMAQRSCCLRIVHSAAGYDEGRGCSPQRLNGALQLTASGRGRRSFQTRDAKKLSG